MKQQAVLLFPHHLFSDSVLLEKNRKIVLFEDPLFFFDEEFPVHFHRQKLMLHRASMKRYESSLKEKGYDVQYISFLNKKSVHNVLVDLAKTGVDQLFLYDVSDDVLHKRVIKAAEETGLELCWNESPLFMTPKGVLSDFFSKRKKLQMTPFYTFQRKRLDVLMTSEGKPLGGKWTYDVENRKKLPKDLHIPELIHVQELEEMKEARDYVNKNFPDAYGEDLSLFYPIDTAGSRRWLDDFFENRFADFGPYEDAFEADEGSLFHSVLTPMLNIGLITAEEVLKKALDYAADHDVPLASLEGFVRQIMGWREFMRAMYALKGRKIRSSNFWKHKRKLPSSFWKGETGIPPVDQAIKRTLQTGYTHHIERLMVLGNFMLLCEIDPHEVYAWFMSLFVDAYDWVMVANVYSMSQFADGGLFTTKPYISSSNYIRKMSHYPKGEWCEVWDGLYWRFIDKHRDFFEKNPRLSVMVMQLKKMDEEKLSLHKKNAQQFLKTLS